MNFLSNTLFNGFLKCESNSVKELIRYFERRKFIRRFGYVYKHHNRGLI